jgi:two-component system response regulator FlrC
LFGYEKGAFTGAMKSMPGKFEQAQGGTIFLDEIGEMKPDLQAKLLRVLQEREVERIGSVKSIQLDLRVLSASNIDMQQAIRDGRFREDLFYRLNVFPLHLPPLRERPKDIAAIAAKLLERHCQHARVQPSIAEVALQKMVAYAWPGNIRELDNVIQRALVMMVGEVINEHDLMFDLALSSQEFKAPTSVVNAVQVDEDDGHFDLKAREVDTILAALKRNNGHRQKTAEDLNLSPRTLRYKLAKLKEQGVDVL